MNILAKKLYKNQEVVDNQVITCEGGRVVAVESLGSQPIDVTYENLAAGLFDTHINGGYQYYFTQHPTEATLHDMELACNESGTAFLLPCLITSSLETILQGIEAVKNYRQKNPNSSIVGMHLEGPFLNPKKRGAHLAKYLRKPTDAELATLCEAGRGVIRLMTVAPEYFSAEQIQQLQAAGIAVAAGHSDATLEEASKGFAAGIGLVTHLYNAMSGLQHREPGLVGATFLHENIYAPLILDGVHCHYGAAKIAYQQKPSHLFLVSDALFVGQRVQHFVWEEFDAMLQNGNYMNSEGNLAGATISLADAVRNAVQELNLPLAEALHMATERPATAIGMQHEIGQIAVGYPAVFTSFSTDLANFSLVKP